MNQEIELVLPVSGGQGTKSSVRFSGPVVLVGANGAGKSRMGRWIEANQTNPDLVHRIAAQKNLKFPRIPVLLPLESAEELLFYGHQDFKTRWGNNKSQKMNARWGAESDQQFYMNDVDGVVAYLFARKRQRDDEFVRSYQGSDSRSTAIPPPEAPTDILLRIWNRLLPTISVAFRDDVVTASRDGKEYSAADMSDGERVIFYLLAQTILARPGMILLVDEPEIHIHKSIISALWNELERVRPDCLFVYMTQDLDFATSRIGGSVIWVKSYDGNCWDWELIPSDLRLPESLLLQILGTRRKVFFTEGDIGSHDALIYSAIMPDASLLPRGGSDDVIVAVKAARNNPLLTSFEICGIIDRDYRGDSQIASLRAENISVLDVAEIEHLYCVPEIIQAVGSHVGFDEARINAATAVIGSTFARDRPLQVFRRAVAGLRQDLGVFSARGSAEAQFRTAFTAFVGSINAVDQYAASEQVYADALASNDEREMLKYFNRKGLYIEVAASLGFKRETYETLVQKLLRDDVGLRNKVSRYFS